MHCEHEKKGSCEACLDYDFLRYWGENERVSDARTGKAFVAEIVTGLKRKVAIQKDHQSGNTRSWMFRVIAPHFVAGVELNQERVIRTAPILRYMEGWKKQQVKDYCHQKGWTCTEWA